MKSEGNVATFKKIRGGYIFKEVHMSFKVRKVRSLSYIMALKVLS